MLPLLNSNSGTDIAVAELIDYPTGPAQKRSLSFSRYPFDQRGFELIDSIEQLVKLPLIPRRAVALIPQS